jgi:hypothetical protein
MCNSDYSTAIFFVFLFMAFATQDLTFGEFFFTPRFFPAPHLVIYFRAWIDMINFEGFYRPTPATFTTMLTNPFETPTPYPVQLVFS